MSNRKKITLAAIGVVVAAAAVTGVVASERNRVDPDTLFETSDKCLACHNGLAATNGNDVSIGTKWRSTIMAHTAKDPYWHAGVRRETLDHPKAKEAIEDKCSTCHMPMARFIQREKGAKGQVLSNIVGGIHRTDTRIEALSDDGVSCTVCHQVAPDNLGQEKSYDGGFIVDTKRPLETRQVYAHFRIAGGTANVMRSATGFNPTQANHLKKAAFCGTCHTLYTHALDKNGKEVAELPEQMPYLEWLHSDYAEAQTCQDCHMAIVPDTAPISSVMGKPREEVSEHLFRGGNFIMIRLLAKNRNHLALSALPEELEANRRAIVSNLTNAAASLSVDPGAASFEEGRLVFPVVVENLTGHKLPTAYPSRRVWLHVVIADGNGQVVFESGALNDNGSVSGNDNDADPLRFEPHYADITEPGQVQIYEAIMGNLKGGVTTGLLSAATYLKDNRLLPSGFDKTTADADVAVAGDALADDSFGAGRDLVTYHVPIGNATGPFSVTAELWYQPIGYRWAMNLSKVQGEEPRQFMQMYHAIPGRETAVRLVETRAVVTPPVAQTPSPLPAAPSAGESPSSNAAPCISPPYKGSRGTARSTRGGRASCPSRGPGLPSSSRLPTTNTVNPNSFISVQAQHPSNRTFWLSHLEI